MFSSLCWLPEVEHARGTSPNSRRFFLFSGTSSVAMWSSCRRSSGMTGQVLVLPFSRLPRPSQRMNWKKLGWGGWDFSGCHFLWGSCSMIWKRIGDEHTHEQKRLTHVARWQRTAPLTGPAADRAGGRRGVGGLTRCRGLRATLPVLEKRWDLLQGRTVDSRWTRPALLGEMCNGGPKKWNKILYSEDSLKISRIL